MVFSNRLVTKGNMEAISADIEREMRNHRGKYIFQGVLFILGGMLAAVFPASTAISVGMVIGAILLGTGIVQLILSFKSQMHWWSLLSAALSMAIGLILLIQPLPILIAFITLLAVFMTVEGVLEILLSLQYRPARNWKWMFASGVVTLMLAMALWIGWPLLGVFYVGLMIAINLIFYGVSLLMLVRAASHSPEAKSQHEDLPL